MDAPGLIESLFETLTTEDPKVHKGIFVLFFLRVPLCPFVVNAVALSGDERERLHPTAG